MPDVRLRLRFVDLPTSDQIYQITSADRWGNNQDSGGKFRMPRSQRRGVGNQQQGRGMHRLQMKIDRRTPALLLYDEGRDKVVSDESGTDGL